MKTGALYRTQPSVENLQIRAERRCPNSDTPWGYGARLRLRGDDVGRSHDRFRVGATVVQLLTQSIHSCSIRESQLSPRKRHSFGFVIRERKPRDFSDLREGDRAENDSVYHQSTRIHHQK